jgi:hypothetical protein
MYRMETLEVLLDAVEVNHSDGENIGQNYTLLFLVLFVLQGDSWMLSIRSI